MALTSLAFVLLATLPGWHQEHDAVTGSDLDIKPFPSRSVLQVILFALTFAALFLLASALWQHVAAASAATLIGSTSQGYLSGHVGSIAAILVWVPLVLVALAAMETYATIMSIHILDRLVDD